MERKVNCSIFILQNDFTTGKHEDVFQSIWISTKVLRTINHEYSAEYGENIIFQLKTIKYQSVTYNLNISGTMSLNKNFVRAGI